MNTALIVDTSPDVYLNYVINDAFYSLNKEFIKTGRKDWHVVFYCSKGLSKLWQASLCPYIEVRELDLMHMPPDSPEYHKFFKSPALWQSLKGDFVLVFSLNSMIINKEPFNIDYFLQKDMSYIGANMSALYGNYTSLSSLPQIASSPPFGKKEENSTEENLTENSKEENSTKETKQEERKWFNYAGGFSLRKRADMLRIATSFSSSVKLTEEESKEEGEEKIEDDSDEAVFFVKNCYNLNLKVGDTIDCVFFGVHTLLCDKFFGIYRVPIIFKELLVRAEHKCDNNIKCYSF